MGLYKHGFVNVTKRVGAANTVLRTLNLDQFVFFIIPITSSFFVHTDGQFQASLYFVYQTYRIRSAKEYV